ncbi:choice-of-anchor Y domain-containing protein, partial [Microcoleus sp. AT10-A2]|uniref:choice-of-anchor Y domain-containing protein n=3 Tax=unclassified Microcoleus TaxID=2642155 RepID=UPI002FD3A2FF
MGQIIINEFRRDGQFQGNEYVELLLTEDVSATQLQSYFVGDSTEPTVAKYSAYRFTNMASIAPVFKAGTILTIGGSPADQEIAYNPIPSGTNNDWNIRLSPQGGFLTKLLPAGNFHGNFAESDVVYVDNASTTNTDTIDSIAWRSPGTGTHGAFGSAAKVQIPAPPNGGNVEFSSAIGGINRTASYTIDSPGSLGLPNGGINSIYINSLRNRSVNIAPNLATPNVNPPIAINENIPSVANTGFSIFNITSELGSDANGDPLGVAVTAADNTNGNWQFSTDGNTWTNFGAVSETSATVLGPTPLYNGLLGNTPSSQNWLSLTNSNFASPTATASEFFSGNGVNLNSSADNSIYAGYTNNPLNPSFPPLDRTTGFSLSFNLQIISESRTNQNRAGFSIVAVTSDRKAIEIGFQRLSENSGNIFAQGDGITPNLVGQTNGLFVAAENVAYNTNIATNYTLRVQGDNYFLSDGSDIILTGPLRDYSGFSDQIDPYETPNFLFLGDGTNSAQANINLTGVSLQTPARVRFVPNPDYYSTPGSEPTITFRAWDGSNGVGNGTAGVNASVTGGTTPFSTNSLTSSIAVNPVNDPPSFVKGVDRTLSSNSGPQTIPGWATAISPGPNESGQTVAFQVVGNDNAALFSVQPAIDSVGTLTFTPMPGAIGSANITLNLRDNGGRDNEGLDTSDTQSFIINLTNPGTFNFSNANYSVNENGQFATITVTRTDANVAAAVSYSTSNGTANAGSDYNQKSGTLNFGIGETTQTFTIPIVDDSEIEEKETVNLTLNNPTNKADLGAISSAVLTIVDTTPTPTPTPAETPTPTGTPTPAETPTPTGTPTPAETPTPTGTPTPAETPTPTGTPTPTPAETPTPTGTPTPTPAETPTPTGTPTPTPAETPTPTGTPTPAETPTPTGTPT